MPRFTWGPDFAVSYPAAPVAVDAAPAKLDVELAFSHVDPQLGTIHLSLPVYDPATHVQPDRVHAVLFADAAAAAAADPETATTSDNPKSHVDAPQYPGGIDLVIPRPEGAQPGVAYTGKTVLQFGV